MNRMSRTGIVAAVLLMLTLAVAAGCGSGNSPGDVVGEYVDALNNQDFDAVYDLSTASYQENNSREDFTGGMEAVWVEGSRLEGFEITGETIEGDMATINFKAKVILPGAPEDSLEESESSVELVKEDGEWRISF